jgi:hypothetical protein
VSRTWRRGAAAAVALVAAACAHHPEARAAATEAPSPPDRVFIDVINDNYYDARIHALYDGGARHALGTVAGNERQSLTIPWLPRPLVFEVVLIVDGGVYRSERMNVAPGELVQLRLPPNIASSGFYRRVSP